MIRATELAGRPVVDIDAAEKVGTIDKIILDPEGRQVAGFVVTRGGSGFPGSKAQVLIPSSAVHAIGPDAVTMRQSAVAGSDISRLETLPRGTDVIGRKVVSEDGRFLGKVSDVLIDRADGRIVGYLLSEYTPSKKWEEMVGREKTKRHLPYLPADAKIRTGRDLIVTSEDAVTHWGNEEQQSETSSGTSATAQWGYSAPPTRGDSAPATEWVNVPAEEELHPIARSSGGDGGEDLDTGGGRNPRVP